MAVSALIQYSVDHKHNSREVTFEEKYMINATASGSTLKVYTISKGFPVKCKNYFSVWPVVSQRCSAASHQDSELRCRGSRMLKAVWIIRPVSDRFSVCTRRINIPGQWTRSSDRAALAPLFQGWVAAYLLADKENEQLEFTLSFVRGCIASLRS